MTDNPDDDFLTRLRDAEVTEQAAMAEWLAGRHAEERSMLVGDLLPDAFARRWLRAELLSRVPSDEAARLAADLLDYRDDFAGNHRDRTTAEVVRHLPRDLLLQEAPFLAGSNAASALWERLADRAGGVSVVQAAERVFQEGSREARESTFYLLLIDLNPPVRLPSADRARLRSIALDDPDDEIRGLAAELTADEEPDRLRLELDRWTHDPSERARAAAWRVAFMDDREQAMTNAAALLGDEDAAIPARRSALIALGDALTTVEIEPLLETMVVHPLPELAEDAANLLWSLHRSPSVAMAAARSPHPAVREVAQQLLDPTRGSPAAGGNRPGAAEQGYDFYDQFKRPDQDG